MINELIFNFKKFNFNTFHHRDRLICQVLEVKKMTEGKFYFLLSTGIALILCGLSIVIPFIQLENESMTLEQIFGYISVISKYILSIDVRILIGVFLMASGTAIIHFAGWSKIKK